MGKPRDLANVVATGNILADGAVAPAELTGVNATAAELNILDGVTATAAELNLLDGVTATTAELNYVDGVTSNVQTQMDTKAPVASPTFTGTATAPTVNASTALQIGGVAITATAAELNKMDGVTVSASDINSVTSKAPTSGPTFTGTVTIGGTTYPTSDGSAGQVLTTNGSGAVSFADPAGGGSADFVASGAIANGDVVSLNSDGTVSVVQGQSQSISTPVVNNSGDSQFTKTVFDSNSNKVVVIYKDGTNSNYGTAAVGTVSGTSISFGTPVVFSSSAISYPSAVFDTNSNKIVISFRNGGNSNYGTAIVGTVSGTTISFGTSAVFDTTNCWQISSTFDSNSNKVVIAYTDASSSNEGNAVVGTVSGTSISFGTPVVFETSCWKNTATFDSNSNKVVISYADLGNSSHGTAVVGTVSGTSISFGTPVVFNSASSDYISSTFDSNANKIVIAYSDNGNSNYSTAIFGTVNGTSISFDTSLVLVSTSANEISAVFDSNSNKVVIAYIDASNSNSATSLVYTPFSTNALSYIGVADGAISNSATGKITINGGINEGQSSLAVGTTYYVADNGDLQTTNNGRKIGKAIATTKILVNSNMSGDEMNAYLGGLV